MSAVSKRLSTNGINRSETFPVTVTEQTAARRQSINTRPTRPGRTGSSARTVAHSRRESTLSSPAGDDEVEARAAESAANIRDLQQRLTAAEDLADQYRKESEVLQSRLEDITAEHILMEEKVHEYEEELEESKNEKREMTRKLREMEAIYEAERSAMIKEKEEMERREEEMQTIIQRLKDTLAQRNQQQQQQQQQYAGSSTESEDDSRSSSRTDGSFTPTTAESSAPSSPPNGLNFAPSSHGASRNEAKSTSQLVLQKDKLIESLRLELAEAQIKLVESENAGGGRVQELENMLMEFRVTNARLIEDNEGFRVLLHEKVLNGDFTRGRLDDDEDDDDDARSTRKTRKRPVEGDSEDALAALEGRSTKGENLGSLADELDGDADSIDLENHLDENEGNLEAMEGKCRRLETELTDMKHQNRELKSYIDSIIERLLRTKGYEQVLENCHLGGMSDAKKNDSNDSKTKPAETKAAPAKNEITPPKPAATRQSSDMSWTASISRAFSGKPRTLTRSETMTIPPTAATGSSSSNTAAAAATAATATTPSTSTYDSEKSAPVPVVRSASIRGRGRPMSEQFGNGRTSNLYRPFDSPISPTFSEARRPARPQTLYMSNGLDISGSGSRPGTSSRTISTPISASGVGFRKNSNSDAASLSGESSTGSVTTVSPIQSSASSSYTTSSDQPQAQGSQSSRQRSTFVGGKPRPLQLVEETEAAIRAENKRSSWIRWPAWGNNNNSNNNNTTNNGGNSAVTSPVAASAGEK